MIGVSKHVFRNDGIKFSFVIGTTVLFHLSLTVHEKGKFVRSITGNRRFVNGPVNSSILAD